MAEPTYVSLKFEAWWSAQTPDIIHLTCANTEIHDGTGAKPGFRVETSSNPRSANYHPGNFNRLSRLLRDHGKPAPAECPLGDRRLRSRLHYLVGEQTSTAALESLPWWADASQVALLADWMARQGDFSASDVAYAVEKPWKYTDEYLAAQKEH